ncbi:hypothetical protein [Streptomyces neyagawaensis]|uniref:hypothetical protein n=1 Tax=Streptomyces neyagawaensis TaxID=42238 RepID=UPI0006E20EA4|nr:hypothetical protein [Streptomyces neyagawaensis]MCL6733318.1 hypothetical protein [Streptomyces neyagawaensis]MDE1685120.1 hypothetical protein [Streptomyces neyagawaensis]
MNCTLCRSPLQHGSLCPTCTIDTLEYIGRLPGLWTELEDWLIPGIRGGAQYGGRARMAEAPLPLDEEALTLRAAGGIAGVLEDWHDAICDARAMATPARTGSLAHRVQTASRGLAEQIHFIALWEQGGQLGREVRQLVARVRRVVEPGYEEDEPKAPTFLGYCVAVDAVGVACGAKLFADMRKAVQCERCLCPYPPDRWLALRQFQPGNEATAARERSAAA